MAAAGSGFLQPFHGYIVIHLFVEALNMEVQFWHYHVSNVF